MGYYARSPESVRSGVEFTPTHRMKATQVSVQAANAELAAEMKRELEECKEWKMGMKEQFLEQQADRIERARIQQEQTAHAVELLKYHKRHEGWEMKTELKKAWTERQQQEVQFAAKAAQVVVKAKKRKAKQTTARHKEAAEHSMAASIASKVERSQRREHALSTKRREEQDAKDFAAQVRYETRPEVRQEGREMFQAQRNASTAQVKEATGANSKKIAAQKEAYLKRQETMKAKVEEMHVESRHSRDALTEEKRQKAAEMRSQLEAERRRKERLAADKEREVREKRDAIYVWNKAGIVEP